jgi:hypothetical protein
MFQERCSAPGARNACPLVLITLSDVRRENTNHEEQRKTCRIDALRVPFDATMPMLTDENMTPFISEHAYGCKFSASRFRPNASNTSATVHEMATDPSHCSPFPARPTILGNERGGGWTTLCPAATRRIEPPHRSRQIGHHRRKGANPIDHGEAATSSDHGVVTGDEGQGGGGCRGAVGMAGKDARRGGPERVHVLRQHLSRQGRSVRERARYVVTRKVVAGVRESGAGCGAFLTDTSLFASLVVRHLPGYFTFEECGDEVNPTIGMEVGVTYTFLQVRTETNVSGCMTMRFP